MRVDVVIGPVEAEKKGCGKVSSAVSCKPSVSAHADESYRPPRPDMVFTGKSAADKEERPTISKARGYESFNSRKNLPIAPVFQV